jgi:hypothetical protein
MTISTYRTVVASASARVYGVPVGPQLLRWPMAEAGSNLDYSLNMALLLTDAEDTIASASFAISPSGTGEMQVTALSIDDTMITAQLAGGVPGRPYVTKFDVVSAATPPRTFQILVAITIDHNPATTVFPLPEPPSAGYGQAATATAAPS